MSHELIQRFIDALHRLEDGRDLDPIVVTFANDCNISNVAAPRTYTGQDGASTFWTHYRAAFGDIHSSFRNVIVDGDHAALEWTTTGTDTAGDPIEYDGVSILDMDGGAMTRFRAFFDSAHLGQQMQPPEESAAGSSTGRAA